MDSGRRGARSVSELPTGRALFFCCSLALVSGMAALGHELLWTRRLVDLLGGSTEASARVLGVFFLGLAVGAAWIARHVQRIERPWRALALVEFAVAVMGLPILYASRLTDWMWPALGPERTVGAWGQLLKTVTSLAFVGPPAVLTGMSLPLLAAGLGRLRSAERARSTEAVLYTANTLGGALGLLLVLAFALPAVGFRGAAASILCLNLGMSLIALLLERCLGRDAVAPSASIGIVDDAPHLGVEQSSHERVAVWLALFSGFGILAAEVIGIRIMMLVAPTSFHAPVSVLFTVIVLLAMSALFTAVWPRFFSIPRLRSGILSVTGVALALVPLTFMGLSRIEEIGTPGSAGGALRFVLALCVWTVTVFGPSLLLAGLILPSLLVTGLGTSRDARACRLARLVAYNGLGGLAGAEFAYRILLPALGPHQAMGALGSLYALCGLVLVATVERDLCTRRLLPGVAGVLATCALTLGVLRHLPVVNPHAGFSVLEESSGPEGTLVAAEHPLHGRVLLLDNQYVLGSSYARADQERQAHLPLLLHPSPRRVAFIGMATGSTPGAALAHPEVEQVDVVEISSDVVRMAHRHFAELNRNLKEDARARVVVEDGRIYLAASLDRFDVVVGDLFLPWGAGAGRLYSIEHFTAVARALRAGGLYCQWLPAYQLTAGQLDRIARTFQVVFPNAQVFRGGFHPDRPTLALVGWKSHSGLDWSVPLKRTTTVRELGAVRDPVVRQGEGLALLYLGPIEWLLPSNDHTSGLIPAINHLDDVSFELDASYERLSGGAPGRYLYGTRWLEFLARRDTAFVGTKLRTATPPAWVARTMRLGVLLSRWESAERTKHPAAEELRRGVVREFPDTIANDVGANWADWPGHGRWTRVGR